SAYKFQALSIAVTRKLYTYFPPIRLLSWIAVDTYVGRGSASESSCSGIESTCTQMRLGPPAQCAMVSARAASLLRPLAAFGVGQDLFDRRQSEHRSGQWTD